MGAALSMAIIGPLVALIGFAINVAAG